MTPRDTCLSCEADCPQAGRDERPRDEDCWEGVCDEQGCDDFYVVLLGPLTADPVYYLMNVRRFCRLAEDLMMHGFVPINPAADALEVIAGEHETDVDALRRRSLSLIRLASLAPRRAAICLGTENQMGEPSVGTHDELLLCDELDIDICYSVQELLRMRGSEP